MPVPSTEVLWRSRAVEVSRHLCTAGPEDRPFDELHRSSVLAFVLAGAFQYRTSTGEASLGPGSVLVGQRGHEFCCSHELGRGDTCLSFSFAEEALDEVRSAVSPRAPLQQPSLPPAPRTRVLLGAVRGALVRRDGAALEELGLALAAAALSWDGAATPPPAGVRERRRVADAMRFIDEHAGEPLALGEIASAVGASPYHFLRGFHAVAGITPHQYLVAARLERAARQLTASEAPVTDIAYECGFGDLSNFIRTFRRAAGASPSAFRRRHRPVIGASSSWYPEAGCSVSPSAPRSSSPAAATIRRSGRSPAG